MKRKSILDAGFRYIPAAKTNVRRTIQRERARLKSIAEAQAAQDEANRAEAEAKVAQLSQTRMARKMAGNGELFVSLLLLGVTALLWVIFASWGCSSRWASSGLKSQWGPMQGCLVKMPDGRWIPDDRVRDIDIAPKKAGS